MEYSVSYVTPLSRDEIQKGKRIRATLRNSNIALLSTENQSLQLRLTYHKAKRGGKIRKLWNPKSRWNGVSRRSREVGTHALEMHLSDPGRAWV